MKKQIFILLALTVGLSACSPYSYHAVSNKEVASNYKTFAWLPEVNSKAENVYANDVATEKIVEATSNALIEKGLKLNNRNPDLLIKYIAGVDTKTKQYNEPVYYNQPARYVPRLGFARGRAFYYYSYQRPYSVYVGSELRQVRVKEGSVMIDLIDRKSGKLIWRGWAEGEINNSEKAINDIPKVVDNIFKQLSTGSQVE